MGNIADETMVSRIIRMTLTAKKARNELLIHANLPSDGGLPAVLASGDRRGGAATTKRVSPAAAAPLVGLT